MWRCYPEIYRQSGGNHHASQPARRVHYRSLDTGGDRLDIELQSVDHPSRVHLDIEADDVEAEVERREALGAKRVKSVKTWWVMEAPTGHRFFVVGKFHDDFDSTARQW